MSIATVSRALRSSPEIGQEMQQRVKALAKKLNYRPNPFAQSLRKEAPRVIGVVLPNLVSHYYSSVLDGIEDEAAKSGYSVISANTHEQSEAEVRVIDNFIGLHVEGIVACLSQNTTDYSHNRIPIDRELVVCERIDYDWALDATLRLLQSDNRPDAILAFNDIITFAAFTAIKQLGLRIPDDVALIGFTDDVHAQYVTPKLSAIEDQSRLMGQTACRLLLKNIAGDRKIYREIVPQKVIIRETSARR